MFYELFMDYNLVIFRIIKFMIEKEIIYDNIIDNIMHKLLSRNRKIAT